MRGGLDTAGRTQMNTNIYGIHKHSCLLGEKVDQSLSYVYSDLKEIYVRAYFIN